MTSVQRNIELFNVLIRAGIGKWKFIITHLDSQSINVFGELAYNILKGVVPLSSSVKYKLAAFKPQLKQLGRKSNTIKDKRHILFAYPKLVKKIINLVLDYFKSD